MPVEDPQLVNDGRQQMLLRPPPDDIATGSLDVPRFAGELPEEHPEASPGESWCPKVPLEVELVPAEQVGLDHVPVLVEDSDEAGYSPGASPST